MHPPWSRRFEHDRICNTQRVRRDRQRRIHHRERRKEGGVDDIQVVDIVCLATRIEDRCSRVGTEPNGSGLMRVDLYPCSFTDDHRKSDLAKHFSRLANQNLVCPDVIRFPCDLDTPSGSQRDTIFRVGQILREQPPIGTTVRGKLNAHLGMWGRCPLIISAWSFPISCTWPSGYG